MGYLANVERERLMERRVREGIAYLDANAPDGWRSKINLRNFNMAEPCQCVLGQVFGYYWDAVQDLAGIDPDADQAPTAWEVDNGFNLPEDADADDDWDALERAWVGALMADSATSSLRWARTPEPRK